MERIRRTKAEQLEGLTDYVSAKVVDHNTVERTLADGTKIIRLHLTDIVAWAFHDKMSDQAVRVVRRYLRAQLGLGN